MILRTKIKKEIIVEFLPPSRVMKHVEVEMNRKHKKKKVAFEVSNAKVIILAKGAPGGPFSNSFLEYWSKKGYWVFTVRYRGTWESGGRFLAQEPTADVIDVIDALPKGFVEGWAGMKFKVNFKKLVLFGVSFGGPAVLFASTDKRVDKVIALSPTVTWSKLGPAETFEQFERYSTQYFGNVMRGTKKDWTRLKKDQMYSPLKEPERIDGSKVLIIQAKDDDSCPWRPCAQLAKKVGATIRLYKKGGHFGTSSTMKAPYAKQIEKFLK